MKVLHEGAREVVSVRVCVRKRERESARERERGTVGVIISSKF